MKQKVKKLWDWAETYKSQQEAIIIQNFNLLRIKPSKIHFKYDLKLDMHEATDTTVEMLDGPRIALRVRDTDYRDFTVRSEAGAGGKTEYIKITKEKFGDYYLYGWINGPIITDWILVDLEQFRDAFDNGYLNEGEGYNDDGSAFMYYSLKDLKKYGCLVNYKLTNDSILNLKPFSCEEFTAI
jgi:hypothetical protein